MGGLRTSFSHHAAIYHGHFFTHWRKLNDINEPRFIMNDFNNPRLPAFIEEFIQLQVKHGILMEAYDIEYWTVERGLQENAKQQVRQATSLDPPRPPTHDYLVSEEKIRHYWENEVTPEVVVKMRELTTRSLSAVGMEATEEMIDSVRHLLIHMATPGVSIGGILKCMGYARIDVTHWPEYFLKPANAGLHLTKGARAMLLWHCMAHAAIHGYSDDL